MKKVLVLFLFLSFNAFALYAPGNLKFSDSRGSKELVFVDFSEATSKIIYDVINKKTTAETTITLYQPVQGNIIFDLVEQPESITINGELTSSTSHTIAQSGSQVRYINKVTEAGTHTLKIVNNIERLISYDSYTKTVRSAFWMSDLSDRRFLEAYLPSNLEYDQYQNNFKVEIIGSEKKHIIRTNGEVTEEEQNKFLIKYPEHYTSSSIYFHLMEEGAFSEENNIYKSIDGREIPVTIYSSWDTSRFMISSLRILAELEKDYGPWPHDFLIVYGAGSGGMEYAGATRTSMRALGHELHHGYFARSMMPSRGNNGWIDEALASWRDNGYDSRAIGSLSPSKMGAHSEYRRTTDRAAYSKGARFMAYLNYDLKDKGGLRPFLKAYFAKYNQQSFITQNFKDELEAWADKNYDYLFNPYIYGRGYKTISHEHAENPMHPKVSHEDQLKLL